MQGQPSPCDALAGSSGVGTYVYVWSWLRPEAMGTTRGHCSAGVLTPLPLGGTSAGLRGKACQGTRFGGRLPNGTAEGGGGYN